MFPKLRPYRVLRRSRRRKNVPAAGHSRIAEEVRVLRGGLALDALYLLARDVDRAGELVGPEHPAGDHILDLPRSEVQILGRLPQGDFLAGFVFHPTNPLARQRRVRAPHKATLALLLALIHRSAWKGYSPKFAGTEFSEVPFDGVLESRHRPAPAHISALDSDGLPA